MRFWIHPPPVPMRTVALQVALVVAAVVGVVAWFGWPALGSGAVLGGPGTDVLRAVWGLDHSWESLPGAPFWTGRMAFPVGAKIVILPQLSAMIGAPLVPLLGPVLAYNAWILGVWAAAGVGSAFLAWRLTDSPAAALLAGVGLTVQPMLFLALSDGTAEFVAWWTVPVALAALHEAGRVDQVDRRVQLRWAAGAGLLLGAVAVDSPYHVVFCAPFVFIVFGWRKWRSQWPTLVALAAGACVLGGLYYGLPISASDNNAPGNAVLLRVWQQWETHDNPRPWDYTLGAGFIPWRVMAALLVCALMRPVRALPWLLVAALGLVWSLHESFDNITMWRTWLGDQGERLGGWIVWFNQHFSPPIVRFPRRWLVPVAQALTIAAALGLTRLPREWMRWVVAVPLCLGVVYHTEALTEFRANLPLSRPPVPVFTSFIAASPEQGAVLFLPRQRGARQAVGRGDLPVFAELSRELASADQLWLQVLTKRGSTFWPEGLRTAVRRSAYDAATDRLLHGLDDAANPQTTGNPIPPSATQEPARRQSAAAALVARGLSFVAIDEAIYLPVGVALIEETFAPLTVASKHFDDGTGVTVLVVKAP